MKKTFLLAMLLMGSMAFAQKTYNLDKKDTVKSYTVTSDVALYQGKMNPVYVSKNGKYFIFVTSKKTGKEYRKYLK